MVFYSFCIIGFIGCGEFLGETGRLKVEISFSGLLGLQARQVSTYERIAQDVADRRKNIRCRGLCSIASEWNQRAELVPMKILEHSRRPANQCLPKKLQH